MKETLPATASGKQAYTAQNAASSGTSGSTQTTVLPADDTAVKAITLSNTLKVRTVTVNKSWEHSGYTGASLEYPIDVTLSCDTIGYSETKTIAAGTYSASFTKLPVYDSTGAVLEYSVTEKVHGSESEQCYGYVLTDPITETKAYSGDSSVVTAYSLENTLPVINVPVRKIWSDELNKYGLRPESIRLTLQRKLHTAEDTAANWVNVPADEAGGTNPRTVTGGSAAAQ